MSRTRFEWTVVKMAACLSLLAAGSPDLGQDNSTVLAGTVTDPFRTPIAIVLVTLSSIERVLQTRSALDGRFRFQGVPIGTYDVEFAGRGFSKQKVSVDLSAGSAQSLAIVLNVGSLPNMDECGPHPSISYESPHSGNPNLTGVARAYDGLKPVARAELELWREDTGEKAATAVADEKGSFRFEKLSAGRYRLKVSHRGYLPTEVMPLLLPRENSVFIDIPIGRNDGKTIICQ
jgi:hypothetical protein